MLLVYLSVCLTVQLIRKYFVQFPIIYIMNNFSINDHLHRVNANTEKLRDFNIYIFHVDYI